MSHLLHQLRRSGLVDATSLDSALRRQQIYGGSLDTVLLELSLIDPASLDQELGRAFELPTAAGWLLERAESRPWSAIPAAIADLGWAMPLAEIDGKVQVALHPEIPDAQMDRLREHDAALAFVVTAECALARVASERTGALTPQRYAVLAARFVQALGGRSEPPPSAVPGAPWRQSSGSPQKSSTLVTHTRQRGGTGPRIAPPPGEGGNLPSWGPQPAPVTPAESEPPPPSPAAAAEADAPQPRVATPAAISVPRKAPDRGIPAFVPPTRSSLFGGVLGRDDPTPAEEIDLAPIIERLDAAAERDQVTDALFDGLELLFERAALYAVRKQKLKRLRSSAAFRHRGPEEVPGDDAVLAAVATATPEMTRGLQASGLRSSLGISGSVSNAIAGVHVAGRAVLLAYADLGGRPVDDAHAERGARLCARAGEALTRIVRAKAGKGKAPTKSAAASPGPAQTPTAIPTSVPDLPSIPGAPRASAGSTSTARTPEPPREDPPRDEPTPLLPRLIDRPPARSNTLISTKVHTDPANLTPLDAPAPRPLGNPAATERTLTPVPSAAPPVRTPPPGAVPPVRNPPPAAGPEAIAPANTPTRPTLLPRSTAVPPRRGTPEPPASLTPSVSPSQEATMKPQMAAVPPVRNAPSPQAPPVRVAPPRSPTMRAPAVAPRVAPGPSAAGAPLNLSQPVGDPSTRGRLVFDEEDRHDDTPDPSERSGVDRIMVDAAIDEAIRDQQAIPRLLDLGEMALARVADRFPGPLDLIKRDLAALPPLPAHGPLIRLTLSIGTRMVPRIRELLDHPDAQVRFYAAFTFQELRDESILDALATRAFDPDGDVRTIAMRVLETYSRAPEFSRRVAAVRAELRSANQTRQVHAARAVGTLRDVAAVPDLINLLDDPERRVRDIGLEALCSITGQQLGTRAARWRSWWTANADRSRVEWIIDALSHKESAVRRWASSELRRITGQPFALPADGSKTERDTVVRQWKQWWEDEGRAEFG